MAVEVIIQHPSSSCIKRMDVLFFKHGEEDAFTEVVPGLGPGVSWPDGALGMQGRTMS